MSANIVDVYTERKIHESTRLAFKIASIKSSRNKHPSRSLQTTSTKFFKSSSARPRSDSIGALLFSQYCAQDLPLIGIKREARQIRFAFRIEFFRPYLKNFLMPEIKSQTLSDDSSE